MGIGAAIGGALFGGSAAATAVGVGVAGLSMYSSYQSGKYQQSQIAAQNDYAARQALIDAQYYNDRLEYSKELEAFSYKKQSFAYQQQAYGYCAWKMQIENAFKQKEYELKQLELQKKAALTDYNAQKDVAELMIMGANESARNAVSETLRVGNENARQANNQLVKGVSKINVALNEGVAGGRENRMVIEEYMKRNEAVSQIDDKDRRSVIEIAAQRDKVKNDVALKAEEARRKLQSVFAYEVSPMARIAPPAPVFTEIQPLPPVAPAGAVPNQVPQISSSGMWANTLSSGISGLYQGYQMGTSFSNWFNQTPTVGVGSPAYYEFNQYGLG
jgi:hypothetical protein